MRVLVVESDRRAADSAIRDLQASGHRVVRCHEADLPAFPCNALCDEGSCPLDTNESVDVVLDYRSHPYPKPTMFEDGASCALRHHVPLVLAGTSALNPFDKWTTSVADDDEIVEVCEAAAKTSLERLAEPALAEVRRQLAAFPRVAALANVDVHRSSGHLHATICVPDDAPEIDGPLAVAVAAVLRAHDRFASAVNVSVQRFGSGRSDES